MPTLLPPTSRGTQRWRATGPKQNSAALRRSSALRQGHGTASRFSIRAIRRGGTHSAGRFDIAVVHGRERLQPVHTDRVIPQQRHIERRLRRSLRAATPGLPEPQRLLDHLRLGRHLRQLDNGSVVSRRSPQAATTTTLATPTPSSPQTVGASITLRHGRRRQRAGYRAVRKRRQRRRRPGYRR